MAVDLEVDEEAFIEFVGMILKEWDRRDALESS